MSGHGPALAMEDTKDLSIMLSGADYSLVRIEWMASSSSGRSWMGEEDLIDLEKTVISVGYVIAENDAYVTIAGSVTLESDNTHSYSQVLSIPNGAIIRDRKLRVR